MYENSLSWIEFLLAEKSTLIYLRGFFMNKVLFFALFMLSTCNVSLNSMNFDDSDYSDIDLGSERESVASKNNELNMAFIKDEESDLSDIEINIQDHHERLLVASIDYPGCTESEMQILVTRGVLSDVGYEINGFYKKDVVSGISFQQGDLLVMLPCWHVFYPETVARTLRIAAVCPQCFKSIYVDDNSGE